MNQTIINSGCALRVAALACIGLGAGASTWAETPLGLMISETLTYDTNVLKDDRQKRSDTVSSTGAKIFFDKEYGRQRYTASVLGVFNRYKNISDYDNDGYQINLGLASELGANGSLSATHARTRSLQDVSNQGLRRYKETLTTESTEVNARYGLYGRWGLSGALNKDEVSYDVNAQQDQEILGARVGLRYNPSDLLFFDLGYKKTNSERDKYPIIYIENGEVASVRGDQIDRNEVNIISKWIVTGYSILDAQVGWTRERHNKDDARNFNGWTGRAAWAFTPRGKMSYSLAFSRDTNNAGGFTSLAGVEGSTAFIGQQAQRRLTTGLQAAATWSATSKISSTAALGWRRLEEEQRNNINGAVENATGTYRSASLGLRYQPTRALSFDCSVESYKRSATVLAVGYGGESLACTAAFLLD